MKRIVLILVAAVALIGASAARAAALPADTTAILSGAASLGAPLPAPVARSLSDPQSVDQTGRFVAFASSSDGLSNEDNDAVFNVYVKDRLTGTVTLVSRRTGAAGAPADQNCTDPVISDNGKRVAFSCEGPLDGADTNGKTEVYLRDLTTNQTILVSRVTDTGAVGDGDSESPALSQDGSVVAFASNSGNLGGPATGDTEVYRSTVSLTGAPPTQTTALVSRPDGATADMPDGSSDTPSISDDGNEIAFESDATNLVTDDNNNSSDAFVRQLPAKTLLVSRATGDKAAVGNGDSSEPMISGDGSQVVFASAATNLDPTVDPQDDTDVYERSLTLNSTGLVDRIGNVKANASARIPSVDDTGKVIAFISNATNLDPAATDGNFQVFVERPGSVTLASRANGPAGAPAPSVDPFGAAPSVSGDGKQVLFGSVGSVTGDVIPGVTTLAIRDLAATTTASVARPPGSDSFSNQGGSASPAVLSADGRYATFTSSAPALGVPGQAFEEVVVRDTVTGQVLLASRADGANGAPMSDAFFPSISADGRRVAFIGDGQVWVRDLVSGSTTLASRADGPGGAPAAGSIIGTSISADGNRVEFVSDAANLGDGDTGTDFEVHVRDLTAGTTMLASRADGAAGATANAQVQQAILSGDGAHVAFATRATNLGDGDTDAQDDVHVRDLVKGTTRLADVAGGGAKANAAATEPSIDANGTRVAFTSPATNLGSTPFSPGQNEVWVHDFAAGTTVLASRADGPDGAPGQLASSKPALSADGRVVAFESGSDNLAQGLRGVVEVFRRTLDAASTAIVSRGPGVAGVPSPTDTDFAGGITADGGCVAFEGDGAMLGVVPGSADYPQTYLRVFKPDCGGRTTTAFGSNDKTLPLLRKVSLTHKRFRVAKARTPLAAGAKAHRKAVARGTALRFTSSEAGRLSILIERARTGHVSGKGRKRVCKPVHKRPRHGACTAYTRTATLTRVIETGAGRVAFSGRLGTRRMAPGTYRLTLTERDAAGNISKPVRLSFTILAG